MDEITRTMPPLRGVVHAAGVVRDAVLLRQRWSEAREVMREQALLKEIRFVEIGEVANCEIDIANLFQAVDGL